MSDPYPQSSLVQCKQLAHSTALPDDAGVLLAEQAFCGHINLRGHSDTLQSLANDVLGTSLPDTANTFVQAEERSIFWLGPDEWLIVTPAEQQASLFEQLYDRIQNDNIFAATCDVSSGQTIITLQGWNARQVLAKGCSLDLHPSVFQPSHCAQTLLAKASVLLYVKAENEFGIVVRRSFADYLWQWLEDAAAEYGFACID